MSDATDWTIVLSGPLAQKAPLLASLDRAGMNLDDQPQDPSYGLPDGGPTVGWVTVRHADVDEASELAVNAGWTLQMHWRTPQCGACLGAGKLTHPITGLGRCAHCLGTGRTSKPAPSPEQQLQSVISDLHSRLAALEAGGQ